MTREAASPASDETAAVALRRLAVYVEAEGFRGYDPYDALNSPLLRWLSLGRKYPRIFFIQVLKRLPINPRPLLGIGKGLNPKALGLFLAGYARLYASTRSEDHARIVDRLLDHLVETRSTGYSGNCWGYNFDWQSRAFYVPRYTPTIVNSSFIGHALIDTYRLVGRKRALSMALGINDFILGDLNRTADGSTFCFSYTPGDCLAVHNANLLGASLLIRLNRYAPDRALEEAALSSLAYSMRRQRPDGSWTYAETDYQGWIDSFHTGFNLQSILCFLEEGFGDGYRAAFERGVRFYREHLFLPDGTPKYYHDRIHPIDIHSAAEGVIFFSRLGRPYREFASLLVEWMIRNLQDDRGYFHFQKGRRLTNRIPYMRWAQAWGFQALAEFCFVRESANGPGG